MPEMMQDRIALDRASVRRVDDNGHLHVERVILSAADVCDYLGREIPGCEQLGLDPNRVYKLYRDPESLAVAAPSMNGKPVLMAHRAVSADDHPYMMTVGSVGSDTEFAAPSLLGSLSIWTADAITAINSGEMRSVSAAYRYRPVMEPGEVDGVRFDGRMLVESFNHLALVEEPRVKTAVIGDAAPKSPPARGPDMAKPMTTLSRQALLASGALYMHLRPKLAQDAKVDLNPVLAGVTGKSFRADRPKITERLATATKGKLAADADLEDVAAVLEAIAPVVEALADEPEVAEVTDADPGDAELRRMLAAKGLSEEEIDKICAMGAAPPEAPALDADKDKDKSPTMDKGITKQAMDAALAQTAKLAADQARRETIAHMAAIAEAREAVKPFVGSIPVAQDNAAAVYKLALDAASVDLAGVPEAAYAAMVKMLPKPGSEPALRAPVAMDAAANAELTKQFPDFNRLKR